MRKPHPMILLVLPLALLAGSVAAEAPAPTEVLGRYWFPDRSGQVELERRGEHFFGRVVSYEVPGQLDEENADPKLRRRLFLGIDMFAGFRFDPEAERWVDGTIYDPQDGRTYDCYLWFEGEDRNVLSARGFFGFSFIGRTERFERVSE